MSKVSTLEPGDVVVHVDGNGVRGVVEQIGPDGTVIVNEGDRKRRTYLDDNTFHLVPRAEQTEEERLRSLLETWVSCDKTEPTETFMFAALEALAPGDTTGPSPDETESQDWPVTIEGMLTLLRWKLEQSVPA